MASKKSLREKLQKTQMEIQKQFGEGDGSLLARQERQVQEVTKEIGGELVEQQSLQLKQYILNKIAVGNVIQVPPGCVVLGYQKDMQSPAVQKFQLVHSCRGFSDVPVADATLLTQQQFAEVVAKDLVMRPGSTEFRVPVALITAFESWQVTCQKDEEAPSDLESSEKRKECIVVVVSVHDCNGNFRTTASSLPITRRGNNTMITTGEWVELENPSPSQFHAMFWLESQRQIGEMLVAIATSLLRQSQRDSN